MSCREISHEVARNLDVDESGDSVVARRTRLYGFTAHNKNAATLYLKFYDDASAPTVGTDTPVLTVAIPPSVTHTVYWDKSIEFANGVGVGATTAVADADTGAPGANDLVLSIVYN